MSQNSIDGEERSRSRSRSPSQKQQLNPWSALTPTLEQLKTIGRELAMGSQGEWNQSKEFLHLVMFIGECRSKTEEDRIILREIETSKRRISDPDVPRRKMKEFIIRLVYIEMLGHDASFGYIQAVKMSIAGFKRTGPTSSPSLRSCYQETSGNYSSVYASPCKSAVSCQSKASTNGVREPNRKAKSSVTACSWCSCS